MPHVTIQVIAPVLTDFYHCMHCEQIFAQSGIGRQVHQEELNQYPEEFKQDFDRLADLLYHLAHHYGDQIDIRVIDPQSVEGVLKSIRYWVRKYPTFIVDGREKIVGWEPEALEAHLQTRLAPN